MTDQPEPTERDESDRIARNLLRERTLHKRLTWLAVKQKHGLSDDDIRTTLVRVDMPRARVLQGSGRINTVADRDPSDPIIFLGDPVGSGDGDAPFTRLDADDTDSL